MARPYYAFVTILVSVEIVCVIEIHYILFYLTSHNVQNSIGLLAIIYDHYIIEQLNKIIHIVNIYLLLLFSLGPLILICVRTLRRGVSQMQRTS